MAKPRLLLLPRSDELLVQFLVRITSCLYDYCWGCSSIGISSLSGSAQPECTISKLPKM